MWAFPCRKLLADWPFPHFSFPAAAANPPISLGSKSPHDQCATFHNIQSDAGFDVEKINVKRNASVAQLYEDAVMYEHAVISASGALINFSGKKTGRSPKDKRIVYEDSSKDDVWVSFFAYCRFSS